jgi:hypothetical protein
MEYKVKLSIDKSEQIVYVAHVYYGERNYIDDLM